MNTTTKIAVAVLAGVVAGGTCPSDVNNDGTVGINDFLAVLAAWGPCPAPQIVDHASTGVRGTNFIVRIWSDGFAEYRAAWSSASQPQQWSPLPVNPDAPQSHPVAVSTSEAPLTIYRQWADGTVDWIRVDEPPQRFMPDPDGWHTETS